MFRWNRVIRLALAVFAVVFATVVYLRIRPRAAKPASGAGTQMNDPTASVESTAGEVILFKGSKQDVRIQYKTRITYQSGRTIFQGSRIIDRAWSMDSLPRYRRLGPLRPRWHCLYGSNT